MTVQQRQEKLIKQISALKDDEVLSMLEQELSFFTRNKGKDIVDGLNSYQLKELIDMVNEWGDKVARDFLNRIDERINLLKKFPNLGAASEKFPGLRGFTYN